MSPRARPASAPASPVAALQAQLDSRALELASSCNKLADMTHERLNRHEQRCDEREAANKEDRHEIAAAIQRAIAELREEIAAGLNKLETRHNESMGTVHARINGGLVAVLGVSGAMILLLLGLVGTLFWKLQGW